MYANCLSKKVSIYIYTRLALFFSFYSIPKLVKPTTTHWRWCVHCVQRSGRMQNQMILIVLAHWPLFFLILFVVSLPGLALTTAQHFPLTNILFSDMKQNDDSNTQSALVEGATAPTFINGRVVIISITSDFGSEHGK